MVPNRTLPKGVHRDHTAEARQTRLLAGAAGGLRARVMGRMAGALADIFCEETKCIHRTHHRPRGAAMYRQGQWGVVLGDEEEEFENCWGSPRALE
jgi:hypothetical protein